MLEPALAPRIELDLRAAGKVLLEYLFQSLGGHSVGDPERDLVVGFERPIVEVARPDRAPHAIHGHDLLVQQRVGILEQAHAAPEQLFEVAMPGVLHHRIIRSPVEGIITRTSTPFATARPKASMASGSGMKCGF